MHHVYVHVPFCKRRCSYCDFSIAVRSPVPADRFLAAVRRELGLRGLQPAAIGPLQTFYLGGGTPSLLPPRCIGPLINRLADLGGAGGEAPEITVEANPDDINERTVAVWQAAGVNRVSLGVQSLDDDVLHWMHRPHTGRGALEALRTLRVVGLPSVSVDLIFGLPAHFRADPLADLERLLEFDPHHVSAYGLTVEHATPLARWVSRGEARMPPAARYADEFLAIHERLARAGFEHYEVSNYALQGHRSRHNTAYWSGRDYLGLGPAAHSYVAGERRWNLRAWSAYARMVEAGRDPAGGAERPDRAQLRLEHLYLGLRRVEGACVTDAGPLAEDYLREALARRWLVREGARLTATLEGWLRLDELVVALTTSV